MPFFSGKDAGFRIGSEDQKFSKWDLEVNAVTVDVSNFTSLGFRERITGFIDGKISASGPYDPTMTEPVVGTSGTFTLTVGLTYTFSFTGLITRIKYGQDVNGAATIEMDAVTSGVFDLDLSA